MGRSTSLKKPLAEEEQLLDGTRPPSDRFSCDSRFYSEFAGILQVELRQHVFGVCMFITIRKDCQ